MDMINEEIFIREMKEIEVNIAKIETMLEKILEILYINT